MSVEIGFTNELCNTQFAPIAAIFAHYQQKQVLQPLEEVVFGSKERDFTTVSKIQQLLVSILSGCNTLSEVNPKLKHETFLARALGWSRFADQSTLSRQLDTLTLKQITPIRNATTQIWRSGSQTLQHDWRGYLWLDYDMSGLPCSERAEESQRGYFSDKKTSLEGN